MSQIAGPIWISTDFLSWDPTPIEMGYGSRNERQESYDLFDHAEHVLERHPDDGEYRADAIVNLNRAIKTRIGHLMKVHELSSHPVYLQMKKKVWRFLQYFSVLRPRLIQGLTDTRNGIEHHGISAPGLAKTLDMLENTWYFLKATDFLAGRPNSGIQFVDGPKTG